MKLRLVLYLLPLIALAVPVSAGDYHFESEEKVPLETTSAPPKDWNFGLIVNGWMPQLSLRFADESLGINNNIFLGFFDDILPNADYLVPLGFDIRYKQFGFAPDLIGAKLSGAGYTPGPFFDRSDISLKMAVITMPAYIRLLDTERTTFDLGGGARYFYQRATLTLSGGPLGGALGGRVTSSNRVEIWDGIVAARLRQQINDKLYALVLGDVGAGASELTWHIMANLGYQFNERFSMEAGYRYMAWEQEDAPADIDLTLSGPTFNLKWIW